jgi:hypothetical protein
MSTKRESKCCKDTHIVDDKILEAEIECITLHEGFQANCLIQYVLETSYYEYVKYTFNYLIVTCKTLAYESTDLPQVVQFLVHIHSMMFLKHTGLNSLLESLQSVLHVTKIR